LIKNNQGCILFRIPPPGRGRGQFFQVIREDFQVVQVGKEKRKRKEKKGGKTKRKEKRKKKV